MAVAASASAVLAAIFYFAGLDRKITSEQQIQSTLSQVQIEERSLRAPATDGLNLYLNAAQARATARLGATRYLATSGGLVALDSAGTVKRRYTTLDGLPDNDLTSLAVFRDRLFIGTATAGLLSFDGNSFKSIRFIKPAATRISALAATESELLIGTLDGGLFESDGERFTRRYNSTTGAEFAKVTALLPFGSRLYIGTQDRGLYVWREGRIEHVPEAAGLPSPRITGIAPLPPSLRGLGSVAVSTDFGVVAVGSDNEVKPVSDQPNITSLAVSGGRLWAGLFGGGIVDLAAKGANRGGASSASRSPRSEVSGLPRGAPALVQASDSLLFALTAEGAFQRDEQSPGPGFEPVASALVAERPVSSDHVTSLAFDGGGRLWIGYFDGGIDILAPESGERLAHIEDDRVREINFIKPDASADRMLVATSRGLVAFDNILKQAVYTQDQNALVSDAIAHVSLREAAPAIASPGGASIVLATGGGLTEIVGGRARSLTAFHGLASNHLYTSAVAGSRLFVGTLAGLVELEGLRVVRSYKTSTSRLSHDWVSALMEAEGTLYVGTNGGGVDALLPSGEWVNFSDELGRFEVNQNAMHFDGLRLYVGSSDRGLLVYNTRARRWARLSAGLPSQSVTAITSDDQFIYAGTLNGMMRIEKRVLGQ